MSSNFDALKKTQKKFIPVKYRAWDSSFEQLNYDSNVKSDTNPGTKLSIELNQPSAKEATDGVRLLLGHNKKIMSFFFSECIKNKAKYTALLNNLYISQSTGIKIGSIRNTINRLIKKGFLQKTSSKKGGAGAPSKYSIPIDIYEHIESELNRHVIQNTAHQDLKNNTYITTELDNNWASIQFDGMKKYEFSSNHIQQLAKLKKITPDGLQQSIDYFVFDLEENNKAKDIEKSPVAFFMGIIRRQGMYTAPKNYESPKDRALRFKLKQEKIQLEKREKMEADLIDVEFKKWETTINSDEKLALMPKSVKNSQFDGERTGFIHNYFKEKIWPSIVEEKYSDCF